LVLGQCGAPPQAALVFLVGPQVVDVLADAVDVRNFVLAVKISSTLARAGSNSGRALSTAVDAALRSRTQASALSPCTSSSHKNSSAGVAAVGVAFAGMVEVEVDEEVAEVGV
jgi:hypothetical protein